nr:DNA topoisomerase [Polyangiaceae bacterium]
HLPRGFVGELPGIFRALAADPSLAPFANRLLASPPGPRPRVFDDRRVSDHHALVPTDKAPRPVARPDAERSSRPDAERSSRPSAESGAKVDREAFIDTLPPEPDRFVARGRVRTRAGWQEVAGLSGETKGEAPLLPNVEVGEKLGGAYQIEAKQTQPPPRFTEATLLGAMETAGNEIDDEALRLAMKDRGLGTPATRAAVIETLLQRGYVRREQKLVVPTALGESLLALLPVASLASPALTGDWEERLARMARGEEQRAGFMRDIEAYVRRAVHEIFHPASTPASASGGPALGRQTPGVLGGGSPVLGGVSPVLGGVSPVLGGVSPVLGGGSSVLGGGSPVLGGASPVLGGASPVLGGVSPTLPTAPSRLRRSAARVDAKQTEASVEMLPLCPKCKQGAIIRGKRAWGCERWREGCTLVIPFEREGKALTAAQLRDLLSRGQTRPSTWLHEGAPARGRLRLDLDASPPALRFESA